jgi:hypothetical protein
MKLIVLLMALLTLYASPSIAGEGGRGDSEVWKEGRWLLADPFVPLQERDEEMYLSAPMEKYLRAIQSLVKKRGLRNDEFWNEFVFNRTGSLQVYNAHGFGEGYIHVGPAFTLTSCKEDPPTLQDPTLIVTIFGCTIGANTYFDNDGFDRLSFRDQALAIIHERLHAYVNYHARLHPFENLKDLNADHQGIYEFVGSLSKLIALRMEQETQKRILTKDEIKIIRRFHQRAVELGFNSLLADGNDEIWPNGGGVVEHRSYLRCNSNSFIGVGSIAWDVTISGNSTVVDSEIAGVEMTDATIINTDFNQLFGVILEKDVIIKNSSFHDVNVEVHDHAKLRFDFKFNGSGVQLELIKNKSNATIEFLPTDDPEFSKVGTCRIKAGKGTMAISGPRELSQRCER